MGYSQSVVCGRRREWRRCGWCCSGPAARRPLSLCSSPRTAPAAPTQQYTGTVANLQQWTSLLAWLPVSRLLCVSRSVGATNHYARFRVLCGWTHMHSSWCLRACSSAAALTSWFRQRVPNKVGKDELQIRTIILEVLNKLHFLHLNSFHPLSLLHASSFSVVIFILNTCSSKHFYIVQRL